MPHHHTRPSIPSDGHEQDYADWLTPERLAQEEQLWSRDKVYLRYAANIRRLLAQEHMVEYVIELGCGTGWVPTQLDETGILRYDAVDRNDGCLALAEQKNADRRHWVHVVKAELRTVEPSADLVCSFAVLKHFRLDEWHDLFVRWFRGARFAMFTVPIATESKSDGYQHTHVWLSEAEVQQAIRDAGHEEMWRDWTDPLEPIIVTRKV